MNADPSIFKAYDIRGIYGKNLFDETATAIARAFATFLKPTKVVVGRDARISGPALHAALTEGLLDSGVSIIDIGMCSTDTYYYACKNFNLPGIMITASHNPKEYNGFKMVKEIPYVLSGDAGIQDIRKIVESDAFEKVGETRGTVEHKDVMEDYLNFISSLIPVANFKKMKVVADASHGMVGPALLRLQDRMPNVEVIPMYCEPDGTFPVHGGDPLIEENRKELMERVVSEGADLGMAFDPDGDRSFFIDGQGRFISGDFMTAILSYYFLQRDPGSTIIYDIRASKAVPDTVEKYGGKSFYNKVGHAFIKKRMSDENAVFGGEVTGHYYFKDFYFCDSGLLTALYLMDALSKTDRSLADVVDDYETRYFISGEINSKVPDVKAKIAEIKEKYGSAADEVIEIDGITCEYPDWRFNVRGSNTEPLIRLNLEAKTPEKMAEKRDEVLALIRG